MIVVTLKPHPVMQEDTGGRKWVVVMAAFFTQFIICGITYSMGILQVVLKNIFAADHFDASWVGSLLLYVTAISSVLFRFIMSRYGCRVSVMLGGVIATVGLSFGIVVTELYQVYICVGVLTGIGFGLACSPSVVAIEQYFHKGRFQALSITMSGIGLGIIAFPVMVRYLLEYYAWRGTLLVLAAAAFNLCACGALMKPARREREIRLLPLLSCLPLHNPLFYAMCIANLFWSFGSAIVYLYLPSYAIQRGTDFETSAFLVSCVGMASFTSRIIFAFMGHNSALDDVTAILCSIGLGAVVTGISPLLFEHFTGQIGYTLLFGFYSGFWTTLMSQVTRELLGPRYIAIGNGYLSFMIALGCLLGGPCAGLLIQEEEEYKYAFYLAGGCLLLSSTIMVLFKYKQCGVPPSSWWSDQKIPLMNGQAETEKLPQPNSTYRYYDEEHMIIETVVTSV